jgi:hypothetical protein
VLAAFEKIVAAMKTLDANIHTRNVGSSKMRWRRFVQATQ